MKFYLKNLTDVKNIKKLVEIFEGKNLIFSLIQNSRELEVDFDVSDIIIYDNSDIMVNTISIEDSIIEINENIDIIPSSYRQKTSEYDFNNISKDLILENYDNIFFIFDENINYTNFPELIYIIDEDSKLTTEKRYILTKILNVDSSKYKVYGYLVNEKFDELKNNLVKNKFLLSNKKSILEKIKGIFKND